MKRTRKQRLFSILLVISMIMQQTFVLPVIAEDHVESETAAAVTQTAEAPETKAAKTEVQEQKAPETQAPATEAPKPEVQEAKETPAPATEAPKPEVQETKETPAPATEAPKPEVQETQETPAPATEAPVTEAPQTEAPVTEAPQTEAPVTEAPQTEAPVTEAPQTEAPETEAPVTEAPETEAPATEAPETETEIKETETETETESETETEAPKTHFTYEDGRVRITADASESAKLPQDAVLKADYLAPGSAAYNAAVAKVKAAYGLGDDVELECAPYDIYFVSKGSRIEPEDGTVTVAIQFVKPVLGEAEGDLIDKGIAHIKDNGSVEDLNGSVNTNAQGEVSSVGFTTDSFSIFAPFTVSQAVPQTATSSNLNQFVTNVVFDNNLYDEEGKLVLHPDSSYSFKMEFAESLDTQLFAKDGELTYTFPSQLTPTGAGGTFDINITAGGKKYTLSGNTYTIEGNTIKVNFNKNGGEAYEALKDATNAEFWLSLSAKVNSDASGDKIKFGDNVEKDVKFDNTASVSVEKNGSYDKATGKMNYTVKVRSTGTSKNVKVTDVISGTLLTYDKNVTATSSKTGALTIDPNATAKGNGFEYTIPSMSDGEEITFHYSASVDYGKLSGDKFTADETKNTVTAKGDNTDEDKKDHNFDHTSAYDTGITKEGKAGQVADGKQTSNWKITINADAKADVSGGLVTDQIKENKKVPTKYSGTGITVKKYRADGSLAGEETIPWSKLDSYSDTSWSYKLPAKDGTPYKYEISYTTESDISKTTEGTSITNHADFDGKGTDGSTGVIGQNNFGVTKSHTTPARDGVNWTVNVTIPNCGFNESFTITDALPNGWYDVNNKHILCADSYKEGSLKIMMGGQEIGKDNYEIHYTDPGTSEGQAKTAGQIQVVFKSEKLTELFPPTTGTERVLTMTYTTIPDPNWPDGQVHVNTVTANGDGTNKTASDNYVLKEHEITKKTSSSEKIDGLPAYRFTIFLQGVDTDTLEVQDSFNTELLEFFQTDDVWKKVQFGAGDYDHEASNGANGSSNGGTITATPTGTGVTFTITNVAKKTGDVYYNYYCITYWLKVKDADALKKLQQMAANDPNHTTKIGNTAEWGDQSSGEVTVDYTVNAVTKTEPGEPSKGNNYTATFQVVVNPDKLQLNKGELLEVKDKFTGSMELVTDSVNVALEPEGTYSWNFDEDKKGLTITIPDGCKATITYQAQITGTGTVSYKNDVTVTGGYSASTGERTATIITDGEGTAEHFQYHVIKRDAGDRLKTLAGAIFQLYEIKGGSETEVTNKDGNEVTFTTDASGKFTMAGAYLEDGWELTKGHTYMLKEIQAPEGYKVAEPITFTVGSGSGSYTNGYTFDVYDEEGKNIDVSVAKAWNDANNQDGKRPDSVMVQLYADGQPQGDPVKLNADNSWSYKWEKLPDKANGNLIEYTVRELQKNENGSMTPVDNGAKITWMVNDEKVAYEAGYSHKDYDWTISNTYTPETTSISGSKTWNDVNNQDGKRPESITIRLWANGKEVKSTGVTKANNWSWSFKDLPKYEKGEAITYTITEDAVEGYSSSVNGYDVTNTHTPGKTSISVTKAWNDADNQDGKRPVKVKVTLYADGAATDKSKELNEANHWSATFENLDERKDGKKIEYTVKEDEVPGYTAVTTGDVEKGYVITNSHTPEKTEISGSKTWEDAENQDGKRPESITIRLWANGKEVKSTGVTKANNWSWSFKDLPKYEKGEKITYTVTEDAVKDYTTVVDGYNVTNSYTPGKTSIHVTKAWEDGDNQDGKRPESVEVKLLADGKETGKSLTLNEKNSWSGEFTDLDVKKDGKDIIYSVEEVTKTAGYTVSVSGDAEKGYEVTNTHKPETINISGSKTWNDANNQDGKRPESITIRLLANGKEVGNREVTKDDNWSWSFTDLPKYEKGEEITYTITEDAVEGYSNQVNGYDVTNTHTPETVELTGTKTWEDGGNIAEIRPETIKLKLYKQVGENAREEVTDVSPTWTGKDTDVWSYRYEGLPKYEEGREIQYHVEEVELIAGYIVSYDKVNPNNITNTLTVPLYGMKIWKDDGNRDGIRPKTIKLKLYKQVGENAREEVTGVSPIWSNTDTDNWSYRYENLPGYEGGKRIRYSVEEVDVKEGYSVSYDTDNGYEITNTHIPGTVEVTGTKIWDDASDQDGLRPDSVTLHLYKEAEGIARTEVTDVSPIWTKNGDEWSYSYKDLPKSEGGKELAYTITEDRVEGYDEPAVDGYNVTNTHTPATIEASVEKIWDDNENQDGKRPETLLVTLMRRIKEQATPLSADDADTNAAEEVTTVELTAAQGWKASVLGLPKYTEGQEYEYFWTEKKENIPEGYKLTNEVTGNTVTEGKGVTAIITSLTNTHKPQKINAVVKKVWDDNNNQDGKRAELTVELMKNGTEVAGTVTLNEENGWTGAVENLDKYTGGVENVYTWVEKDLPEEYQLTETKKEVTEATDDTLEAAITTLTNQHTPGKVSASILKIWDDADNQDGIRPEAITAILLKNGEETEQSVTLSADNDWSAIITDLDEYTDGTLNEYTWKEAEVPEGYELSLNKTEGVFTTLKNTHTPETISIEGTKTWYDGGNESARPESITIRIYADGEELTKLAKTVTADDDWKWSFTDLPKYKEGEVGQEITYTITEDPVDGYISEVNGYDVTNTRSAAVSKVDIGTGEELTGAHFQVLDGAGTIVDEWDSESGTNHVIKGIKTGEEYTLHESKAPEGYEVTADVTFTVAKDGTVTASASVVNGVIIVEDKLKPSENTSTTIEKKVTYNGLELFAENLSFYVRLFYDEACTKPATELKEIKIVNAASGKVTFDNLEAGRTYYVGECDADGNVMYSGVLEDGTVYTPVFTGTNGQVVTVEEGEDKVVYLDNQLQSWPHNFYANGTLTVTKKLLGADGEAKDSDEVFYAGIFDDPEYTTLSEKVEYNVLELDMSGGSETSMSTNVQIESLNSVTRLYVTEVDEDGNPVKGAPGFAYEVSADKTEVNIDPTHTKAEVTITNKEKSYEGKLTVTKKLVTEDDKPKDSDETFYAGIFDDADFTQLSDKVEENILTLALNGASEVTAQTKVKVDSADSVTTLYVTEVDVDGNPVKKMAGFKYGVSVDKEEVEIAAGKGASVTIKNMELPGNLYKYGKLTVTKKLLGADGKPKNSDGVFYAGIFDDPEYTTLSDKAKYNILELDLNGNAEAVATTEVEILAKDSTTTLYVTEVDEEGNPIAGAAGFKYEVSVDKTKVDLTAERSDATVVITNKEIPETETESETQPTTKPTKGVKTGDDTPIGGYAGLMAITFAAFALLVVSEQKRRKSGRE